MNVMTNTGTRNNAGKLLQLQKKRRSNSITRRILIMMRDRIRNVAEDRMRKKKSSLSQKLTIIISRAEVGGSALIAQRRPRLFPLESCDHDHDHELRCNSSIILLSCRTKPK